MIKRERDTALEKEEKRPLLNLFLEMYSSFTITVV